MIKKLHKDQRGVMLVAVIIISSVLILIGFSLASFTASQYSISNNKVFSANALMVAEAGIEDALKELNADIDFAGHSTEQVFFDNTTQGRGAFVSTVTPTADSNAKIIESTGNVYRYGKSAVESSRSVKVTIVGTESEGYSVHTGPGGLLLGGSANITNSDVYVNGYIQMTGSARIGTFDQPLKVDVAHINCPEGASPGATFPTLCSTGQPISTSWSTKIYGDVCATNQTSNNYPSGNPEGNILPGSTGQGLILGCVAPQVSTPTYDKAAHVAAVTTTSGSSNNTYVCNKAPFERTWPANLQLNGDVELKGSCDVTLKGNAYITGDLDIGGASKIRVADSVGTTRPVVLVDGNIDVGGSASIIANSDGTGIQFISYKAVAACDPNCTSLSGNDLYNSMNNRTVDIGGAVNLPGMVFQSYWGEIRLRGSGSIGAAIGQRVDLNGAGTVTFGTALSSGDRTWTISSYQQTFPD